MAIAAAASPRMMTVGNYMRRFSFFYRRFKTESTHGELTPTAITSVNQDHLLRVCTILYQQQDSSDSRLASKLSSTEFQLTHEFFLQVCHKFPLSWRPVHRFFLYAQTHDPEFPHSSTTFNKMLDVIGKSRNTDLFWEMAQETGRRRLANDKTFRIVLKTLASARELKKCVNFFHLMNDFGYSYNVQTLNRAVETLCKNKLVEETKFVVTKLKECIKPNEITYRTMIEGFCDVGDLIEAAKLWNLMIDEGFELDIEAGKKIMETFFKKNQYEEAMKVFNVIKLRKAEDLDASFYRIVIDPMCKNGRIETAREMFDEMRQRGIQVDNLTWASIIYGLLVRRRVAEAYKILEGIENPDIGIYHALIKGLLKMKRAGEATDVFREMIKRGCEPIMHTYIMLLQGHLGKRGRKGPDPLVNFDTVFVGGLIKAGKRLEATKYVERTMERGLEVPRFDYSMFLHCYSNEEGVVMFEEIAKKFREVGSFDLADIFQRYGEKMATRDRRRERAIAS
ncbi:PREDICTED: putative pentatricopeptide repeat-containing protein At1g26500 [Tarenaya hassleriana]|uniref:putative pentatricopeptide repeat-containing protein At1g26500 n=1 Tax=Tarenaya hassleriana TaxID=28532 RepID=UPI00053C0DB8|nr:PREDICTED: putative pentatricopeptide repeat-containing protein At1g26500 [Tarenaya hassleriana]